jgi:phage tail-like protein
MNGDREIRTVVDRDQWLRCSHQRIALLADGGVQLTWEEGDPSPAVCAAPSLPSGLAFDRWCRGYRSRPERGTVEVGESTGVTVPGPPGGLDRPRGLAVDTNQRLYVAESCAGVVHVVDLWAQRQLRRTPVRGRSHPERQPRDVAAHAEGVLALVDKPPGLLTLAGRRDPRPGPELVVPCYPPDLRPDRVATSGQSVLVLWTTPDRPAALVTRPDGSGRLPVPGATDIELDAEGLLVVARRPGQSFLRFRPDGNGWAAAEPLQAEGYDGGAVSATPDGRMAYTSRRGWRWTSGSAARHVASGSVLTYRLDAGDYRARWGRVFLDACLPAGTGLALRFVTTDEDDVRDPVEPTPAGRGGSRVRRPEATPPMPSRPLLDQLTSAVPVFRRPRGSELPWQEADPSNPFHTYECPVTAPPGRYLWLVLELTGNAKVSPQVRGLRIEAPGHRLARTLPRIWSAQERDADFVQRFLAPAEGMLHELDGRAALRAVLLDPSATPAEALAWLGSFVGLVLDRRWSLEARRELVASAFELFRIRGTQHCLERLIAIYLRVPVTVVENWRLRGLGGGVLGAVRTDAEAPVVGAGTHVASELGRFSLGGRLPGEDGYTATAHRFAVIVGLQLGSEREQVVRHILETHKPAHTEVTLCQIGAGMRLGRTTRVGLTTFAGAGAGWGPAVVGQVLVGADGVVGLPSPGSRVESTTVVGEVRVG